MTPEGEIQNAIMEYLWYNKILAWRNNNTPTFNIKTNTYRSMGKWAKKGVSDIIAIKNGTVYFIEVKAKGKYPSKEQKQFIIDVNEAGGIAFVARSIDDVSKIL